MNTTDNSKLLLLFDGNALVHRAFHALPALTVSKTGEMVNGVQGFASTLLKVLKDFKPGYWAIAFDRPSPTFRHEKFAEYKKQRPPTPPELISQIKRVHQVTETFNIPIFEVDGFEADDILGTLAVKASGQGMDVLIVTGDNDILQLVTPHVKVLAPRRGFSDTVVYDEEAVKAKYGILPNQVSDLKAFTGDTSDNIPGVKGVGEKTAVKVLQQYETVENVYKNLDSLEPVKLRELLREFHDRVQENKELTTIVTDIDLPFDPEKCRVTAYDRQKVVDLFRELEFVGLLNRLPEGFHDTSAETSSRVTPEGNYTVISTVEALDALIDHIKSCPEFAFDMETSGLNVLLAFPVDFSLSCSDGEAYCVPVGHRGLSAVTQLPLTDVVAKLKPLFEDAGKPKIAQNGKFDMMALAGQGIQVKNLAFDTMLAAYLLGEKSIGLKALSFNKLGIEMKPITDLIGTGAKQITMDMVDIEQAAQYSCADADITFRLKGVLEEELRKQNLWQLFNEVEVPLVPVLASMEMDGVALNTGLLKSLSQSMGEELARLEKDIYSSIGHQFNINSSQQLSQVLYEELSLPKPRKTKSGYSTDASILEEMKDQHGVIPLILQYRQLTKLKSTYTDSLLSLVNPKTGRVHTSFNQTGTTTGRLSSSDPNLQNIPIRTELGAQIRKAIIATSGWYLLSADYSQIDLRALAHISQDPELIATFLRNDDIHTATASKVFNVPVQEVTSSMRRAAKTVNFGVIYGMSDYGLEQATDFSREEASKFIVAYFEKYPGVKKYIEDTKKQAREQGYVQTVLGRRRYIPEIQSPNRLIREGAERMAINMPVQGTSADIIKIAMINIYREMTDRGLSSKMILQVHDELVFDIPSRELDIMKELVGRLMPSALKLVVPLKIDVKIGRNWGEMS
jgi:DNA polymerase I